MRIAVISDVHGNLAALDAVLADIGRRGVDATVDLGDCLSGPLWPAETADRLIALGLPTLRGNHERQLLDLPPHRMGASDAFAHRHLDAGHRAWIAGLPATLALTPDVFLCHGTPASDLDYLLHTVEPAGARDATAEEVALRAAGCPAALILCGHTHLPRRRDLADGRVVVNPGSVGLPAYGDDRPFPHAMEAGTPHARYAVASLGPGGAWTVEHLAVDYDWESAARLAAANGREDWAVALRTGRVRPPAAGRG